jgi:hypothetical protein
MEKGNFDAKIKNYLRLDLCYNILSIMLRGLENLCLNFHIFIACQFFLIKTKNVYYLLKLNFFGM